METQKYTFEEVVKDFEDFDELPYSNKLELFKKYSPDFCFFCINHKDRNFYSVGIQNFKELNWIYSTPNQRTFTVYPNDEEKLYELIQFIINTQQLALSDINYEENYRIKIKVCASTKDFLEEETNRNLPIWKQEKFVAKKEVDTFLYAGSRTFFENKEEMFERFFILFKSFQGSNNERNYFSFFRDIVDLYNSYRNGFFKCKYYYFLLDQKERLERGENIRGTETPQPEKVEDIVKILAFQFIDNIVTRKDFAKEHSLNKKSLDTYCSRYAKGELNNTIDENMENISSFLLKNNYSKGVEKLGSKIKEIKSNKTSNMLPKFY